MNDTVWRGYTRAGLDAQYQVSEPATPEREAERERVALENARVRGALECRLDVAYGHSPAETLDIFPARQAGSPIVVFIHGGYWKQFSKADESQYADIFVPAGAAYVSIDYALAPVVSLDEIVRQCRTAITWIANTGRSFGGDPTRIHLIGRSAGGHLAAMMLATEWETLSLPGDPIAGATLISGLYELEPIRLSFVNHWTRLDAPAARRLSPSARLPRAPLPLIVSWGGAETDEFRRQSIDYADLCQARGHDVTRIEIPGARHAGSRAELTRRDRPLLKAVLAQCGLA